MIKFFVQMDYFMMITYLSWHEIRWDNEFPNRSLFFLYKKIKMVNLKHEQYPSSSLKKE